MNPTDSTMSQNVLRVSKKKKPLMRLLKKLGKNYFLKSSEPVLLG